MLNNVFYHQPETPEFLRCVPGLGRWQPPHDLPQDWAATHFMSTFIGHKKFNTLEEHASTLRNGLDCSSVLDEIIAGGQHVLVKLQFDDGVVWLARISFPSCPKNDLHGSCVGGFRDYAKEVLRMESEIASLQYVEEMTLVPVPRVFGHNLLDNNGVGGPYMLMEMIPGESLEQYIERHGGISHTEVQGILDQMSNYVAQLSSLRFDGIGRLQFGESPSSPRLVPLEESTCSEPYKSAAHYFTDHLAQRVLLPGRTEDAAVSVPTHWTNADFDEKVKISTLIYKRAAQTLGCNFSSGPFPLQHVDLNQQNIIVDEHCNVRGIVDWENAMTSPFECYDIRLMRIFKLSWQEWKGLDWVEDYAYSSFMKFENDHQLPQLSAVYHTPNGSLGRIIEKPFSARQFVEQVVELVKYLYHVFESHAEEIVPRDVATEIIEPSQE